MILDIVNRFLKHCKLKYDCEDQCFTDMNKTTEGVTKQSGTNLLPLIVTSDINIQPGNSILL